MSRGTAYAQLKQYDKSIADWLKVAELHPEMVKAHYNLGKQYYASGDFDNAAKYFQEVVRLAPENPAGHCERARSLAAKSLWEESLQCWSKALQFDKQNPELYVGRAKIFLQLDDVEAAVRDYNDAVALNPADPLSYERRGPLVQFAVVFNRYAHTLFAAACHLKLKQIERGRQDMMTAKKLRWMINYEKVCFETMVAQKNQSAPSHMAVVRAAKAAAAASVQKAAEESAKVVAGASEDGSSKAPADQAAISQDPSGDDGSAGSENTSQADVAPSMSQPDEGGADAGNPETMASLM